MGHSIQAIIGRADVLDGARSWFDRVIVVSLEQGMSMVPATHAFLDATDEHFSAHRGDQSLDGFIYGTPQLSHALGQLSLKGPVAYVETEYFGGVGTQSAAAYNGGSPVFVVNDSQGSISRALSHLGIKKQGHFDEFDALGLSRYRSMDRWTEDD